jgi:hypothetical protein
VIFQLATHVHFPVLLEAFQFLIPKVLNILLASNLNKPHSVPLPNFFLQRLQLLDVNFPLILFSGIFNFLEHFMLGHDQIFMFFLNVHISTLFNGLENSAVRIGPLHLVIGPVLNLNM